MKISELDQENNNNDFNSINIRKSDILSLIEKTNKERNQAMSNYSSIRIDYKLLQDKFNSLERDYKNLRKEYEKANSKSLFSSKKMEENLKILFSTEKKLSEITNQNDILTRTNALLEGEVTEYKNIYNDCKSRKNKEILSLKGIIEENKKDKDNLIKENITLKREINKYKMKNESLSKEIETVKSDNDNLTRIIEEHNEIVKTSEIKVQSFDNTINEYKKQIDKLNLEIDKIKLEKKKEIENYKKIKDEFEEEILKRDNNFENALNNMRKYLQEKIEIKIKEYNELRSDYINSKIERDKYYHEYNLLKEDYNKNNNRFKENYLNIQKEKKEKESELNKQISYLNDKANALLDENMRLKNNMKDLESKLKDYKIEKESRLKLERKNKEINEELNKINRNNEGLIEENQKLKMKLNELLISGEN